LSYVPSLELWPTGCCRNAATVSIAWEFQSR